ncbi:ribosome biogenesis [Stylonychia lemnae]|uniref:Ribosome biogenesis n=1 Tax=Stylonychia lemnae TaxID=5949 RepID=A0A078B4M9_STYLE|nr:ribosome biogenesis [Stylonychia lemnae]|eukprot:CDW89490.1 ribosome biogenesis [Stylonychia lemnae]
MESQDHQENKNNLEGDKKDKPQPQKEGKVIVRNLGFDLKEVHLKKEFQKYGKIIDANVPLKNETNTNRGFGFIEFSTKEEAQKAIDGMNGQKYKGRVIAVEFSAPSRKYENRVQSFIDNTKMSRQDIVQPLVIRNEKEEKLKAKEEREKSQAEKKDQYQKQKIANKEEAKAKYEKEPQRLNKTLFVRNIGYDTNEQQFKEFMGKFGDVKYALLVKVKELQLNHESGEAMTHKGTGFVQFKNPNVAEQLIELSNSIEIKLDEECKTNRLNAKKNKGKLEDNKGVLSVITGELELNGRRLVIKEAMSKSEAIDKHAEDQSKKQMKEDKRNLNYKKEGLLNEETWIHKKPRPSEKQIEQRQRLLKEKDAALTKNTNLFVSKKRIQIRNLPRRDFFEKELKELMMVVVEEWLKTVDDKKLKEQNKKKFLKQVKILRDQEKIDTQSGDKLASGLGFAEFGDEELALYALRYLNNMELVTNKGLIADFSLEDQRAIHKREVKFEKQKKLNQDKKREEKMEKKQQDEKKALLPTSGVVDLGKRNQPEKLDKESIDKITDLELLHQMMRQTISRGKKQRIKKRIDKLEAERGIVRELPAKDKTPKLPQQQQERPKVEVPKVSAQEKVKSLLKKREEKLMQKDQKKKDKFKNNITDEEREIMKKIKNKKKDKKRQQARETDEFDDILDTYKNKVLKKIKKSLAGASKKQITEGDFEEVDLSD